MKKRFKAWLHFTKTDDDSAGFNICKMIISSNVETPAIRFNSILLNTDLNSRITMYFDTRSVLRVNTVSYNICTTQAGRADFSSD